MNIYSQNNDSITEENPALEEGISFLIPSGEVNDQEVLNEFVNELGRYYEVKLKKKPHAYTFTCLNAIERDTLSTLSSLLEYMSMRESVIRLLLDEYGFGKTSVSLFFSHNCYGYFSLKPINGLKAADRRKPGRVIEW